MALLQSQRMKFPQTLGNESLRESINQDVDDTIEERTEDDEEEDKDYFPVLDKSSRDYNDFSAVILRQFVRKKKPVRKQR